MRNIKTQRVCAGLSKGSWKVGELFWTLSVTKFCTFVEKYAYFLLFSTRIICLDFHYSEIGTEPRFLIDGQIIDAVQEYTRLGT